MLHFFEHGGTVKCPAIRCCDVSLTSVLFRRHEGLPVPGGARRWPHRDHSGGERVAALARGYRRSAVPGCLVRVVNRGANAGRAPLERAGRPRRRPTPPSRRLASPATEEAVYRLEAGLLEPLIGEVVKADQAATTGLCEHPLGGAARRYPAATPPPSDRQLSTSLTASRSFDCLSP